MNNKNQGVSKEVERAKELMAEVYGKGFNIYRCLNKLKKIIKLTEDFPPEAIIWTCESFLRTKEPIQNHWAWFVRVFRANSERFFSEKQVKEGEKHKKAPVPESIKKIMRGMQW